LFFLYLGKKVPVRRTGAYRHKKSPAIKYKAIGYTISCKDPECFSIVHH